METKKLMEKAINLINEFYPIVSGMNFKLPLRQEDLLKWITDLPQAGIRQESWHGRWSAS